MNNITSIVTYDEAVSAEYDDLDRKIVLGEIIPVYTSFYTNMLYITKEDLLKALSKEQQ